MSVSPLETIESLEQLRVLWHGYPIAVETAKEAPAAGVDTQEDWTGFAPSLRPSETSKASFAKISAAGFAKI